MKLLKILWEQLFPKRQIECDCNSCSEKVEKETKPKEPTEHELKIKHCDENKIPEDYVLTNLDLMKIYEYLHYVQCVYNMDSKVGYVPGVSMVLMNKIAIILNRTKVNV